MTVMDVIMKPKELSLLAVNAFGAMQKVLEFEALLDVLSFHKIQNILEIGSGRGGTSWAWTKLGANVTAIDLPTGPWGGSITPETIQYIKENATGSFTYIAGDSCDPKTFKQVDNKKFDFLFIDGDHSYEGVKQDYKTYSKLVKSSGLIALHDICDHDVSTGCEVAKFWRELELYEKTRAIKKDPTTWGGLGLVYK